MYTLIAFNTKQYKNMSIAINYWAIIVSGILSVVLGFIWYGPLFGKKWMALSGISMPDVKPPMSVMVKPMIISVVGALFMGYMMAMGISIAASLGQTGIGCALFIAFSNWLGFVIPVNLNIFAWEKRSWTLFAINSGYWLVLLAIIAVVIGVWG